MFEQLAAEDTPMGELTLRRRRELTGGTSANTVHVAR